MFSTTVKLELVLFFVLFTFADISIPGFCRTDDHSPAPQSVTDIGMPPAYSHEKTNTPSQAANEEDCFCCCSHIIPYGGTVGVNAPKKGEVYELEITPPKLPSSLSIYHPPRNV